MLAKEGDLSLHPTVTIESTTPVPTPHETAGKVELQSGPADDQTTRDNATFDRPTSFIGEAFFISVLCSAQLLTQCGLAMSIVPQHIIAQSFGIENDPGTLSWFSAGYSLTVGTFILIAGRLGDVFGHKRLFVSGFVWFGLWSAIAGFSVWSRSAPFLAFCRGMQGIGPAFLLPNAIAMIARAYEPGLRQNLCFSLFGATAPGGFVLGAVFSSLLSQTAWWPWAYWVMGFACVAFAVLGVSAIPKSTPSTSESQVERASIWHRIDIFGSIAGVVALVLFNFAWNQGPVVGWQTPYTYTIMIIGMLAFVAFVVIEQRVSHPLVPIASLRIDSIFTLGCIAGGWASFGIFVYYLLDILEVQRRQSALHSAAQMAPIAISGLCAAVTTGLMLSKFRASTVMLVAMTAFLAGGLIIATMPIHQTYWAQTFVGIVILPWGMDMSFPAATIILSRSMSREDQGVAASLVNTFVNYSISIGLGFAGTVFSQVSNNGRDVVKGERGAFYLGVGFAGLGVVLALIFCFVERHQSRVSKEIAQSEKATV